MFLLTRRDERWSRCAPGMCFASRLLVGSASGPLIAVGAMRETLLRIDLEGIRLDVETRLPHGDAAPETVLRSERRILVNEPREAPQVLEERAEVVQVPAGRFACTYRRSRRLVSLRVLGLSAAGLGDEPWAAFVSARADLGLGLALTEELWFDDALPVPYRSVVRTDEGPSQTVFSQELTRSGPAGAA